MPQTEFKRSLTLFDATMLVVGSMIGSGIFIVSADMTRMLGSGGYLLLTWAVTGALTLIAALSYGELAGMNPKAGGQYVYLREAFGPAAGFLYGWTLFTVIQTGTIAAVAVAFAKYTSVLWPSLGESKELMSIGNFRISAAQTVAVLSVIILTALNIFGVRAGKLVQNTFTVAKTAALLGIILLGLIIGAQTGAFSENLTNLWEPTRTFIAKKADGTMSIIGVETLSGIGLLMAIGAAMVGSLFSSDAWNNITFAAGEVKNPKRTIPLGLALGVAIVTGLYILANIAYLFLLPVHGTPDAADVAGRGMQFALNDRVGSAAAEVLFGGTGAVIMAVLIMISTFGCNNGLILAGARVYYAMANDGLFFRKAGKLNGNAVPAFALAIQAVWACILCLSGGYGALLDYVITVVLVFYILTILGVFALRRKRPDAERPYKAFGYPILPLFYIATAAFIIVSLVVNKTTEAGIGLAIVAAGIPAYFIWKRKTANEPAEIPPL